jgi:hypothetical protein
LRETIVGSNQEKTIRMEQLKINKIKFNLKGLEEVDFNGYLMLSQVDELFLKIYRTQEKMLNDRLLFNATSINPSKDIILNVADVEDYSELNKIDFKGTRIRDAEIGFDHFPGEESYIKIHIPEILVYRKIYDCPQRMQSKYILNEASKNIIKSNHRFTYNNIGLLSVENKQNRFKKFLDISFKHELRFREEKDIQISNEYTTQLFPLLLVNHERKDIHFISNYVESINLLTSFYISEEVDFMYGQYFTNDCEITHFKRLSMHMNVTGATKCNHAAHLGLYQFFSSIKNKREVIKEITLLKDLVDRFILAEKMDGRAKFMLLFSIIDGVRNFYIKSKPNFYIKEFFEFSLGKHKTDKTIKNKIIELKDVLKKKDQKEFIESVNGKAIEIKRYPVKLQFDIFFKKLKVDLSNYKLDLNEVIGIRNQIFHGHIFEIEKLQLNILNSKMRDLCSLLITTIMNSKDIFHGQNIRRIYK